MVLMFFATYNNKSISATAQSTEQATWIIEKDITSAKRTKLQEAKAAFERARSEAEAAAERLKASFDTYNMVLVDGGTFTIGCTPEQGKDCDNDEKPAHQVTLSDFYIGKYEVTKALWNEVMGERDKAMNTKVGASSLEVALDALTIALEADDPPVTNVSWDDAQEFINKLNALTEGNYRLPTEAEWEYAARGGGQSQGYKHSGSNNIKDVGWYTNTWGTTRTIGQKKPNELGIHDMSGNVWEWVYDWFGDYDSSLQTNPQGPSSGSKRVVRGGGFHSRASRTRVSSRASRDPGFRDDEFGFRLAHSSTWKDNAYEALHEMERTIAEMEEEIRQEESIRREKEEARLQALARPAEEDFDEERNFRTYIRARMGNFEVLDDDEVISAAQGKFKLDEVQALRVFDQEIERLNQEVAREAARIERINKYQEDFEIFVLDGVIDKSERDVLNAIAENLSMTAEEIKTAESDYVFTDESASPAAKKSTPSK